MKNMKKFVAALLVLTMVLAMTSVAFAYKEKKLDDPINVLFKKSAYGYKKVTNNYGKSKSSVALRKDSVAFAVAEKGSWYKIAVPKSGKVADDPEETKYEYLWFNKKYVKNIGERDYEALKYVFSSGGSGRSIQAGDSDDDPGIAKLKVKTSGKVDLRKTASLKGKSLGTVKSGKKVTLTGKYGYDNWVTRYFQVKYGKKTGYIADTYIRAADVKKIESKMTVSGDSDDSDDEGEDY